MRWRVQERHELRLSKRCGSLNRFFGKIQVPVRLIKGTMCVLSSLSDAWSKDDATADLFDQTIRLHFLDNTISPLMNRPLEVGLNVDHGVGDEFDFESIVEFSDLSQFRRFS